MFWAGHEGQGLLEEGEDLPLSPRHGVDLLVESLRAEEMEVVTVGPQSNLAAALIKEPAIAGRISHLTVMGGFFHACELEGRVVPPTVDYNLNADPGAAVRALSALIPTTFVPADVTMRAWLLEKDLRRLEESKDPLRQALVAAGAHLDAAPAAPAGVPGSPCGDRAGRHPARPAGRGHASRPSLREDGDAEGHRRHRGRPRAHLHRPGGRSRGGGGDGRRRPRLRRVLAGDGAGGLERSPVNRSRLRAVLRRE